MKIFTTAKLRLPLIPFELLSDVTTPEQILELFRIPEYKEAIYLASPTLYDELQKGTVNAKLIASLTKYLQRSATRCTPFGVFASCSAVSISSNNDTNENIYFTNRRHTRLDMNYLCALAQHLENHPKVKSNLVFYPNSGIYEILDKIRYTESNILSGSRKYLLSAVDNNMYLKKLLFRAKDGLTVDQLNQILITEQIDSSEADQYIAELIKSQILVSNLEPAVSGLEFLDQILEILKLIPDPEVINIYKILLKCQAQIKAIDTTKLGIDVAQFREIGEELKHLGVHFDWQNLFQVDLHRDTNFEVDEKIAKDVLKAIEVLGKLSVPHVNGNLEKFKKAFLDQYEEREVPLNTVLDSENGLGYPFKENKENDNCPLLDGFRPSTQTSNHVELKWYPVHKFLLKKIMDCKADKSNTIQILDSEIEGFKFDLQSMSDTFSTIASVLEYDKEKNSHLILVSNAGGSSAVKLLGRFCYGDEKLEELALNITSKEDELNPDIIFAEIVHLPESRTGNVILRPVLRKYEINYLAKSGVEQEHNISLKDLMVSVKSDKIILRSKRLNKIVVPRLSNAHSFNNSSLPIYRFLCDLQTHYSTEYVALDLSFFEAQLPFIPRITYKNFIFSPAKWKFKKEEMNFLNVSDAGAKEAISKFIKEHSLPQRMLLIEGDNQLYVDWLNILSVKSLLDNIKNQKEVILVEFLFNSSKPYIKTDLGSFTNQLLFCFYKEKKAQLLTENLKINNIVIKPAINKRSFIPGSEWLYFKIYTGVKTSDRILTERLFALIQQLKNDMLITKFFFIRYNDPKNHIRFRLNLTEKGHNANLLEFFQKNLELYHNNGLINSIQLDTYHRELERYGDNFIELTETLFDLDSELCMKIITLLDNDQGDELRWKIELLILDTYFKSFDLNEDEIIYFTDGCKRAFETEFKIFKQQKVQIDSLYRKNRPDINSVLSGGYMFENYHNEMIAEFGLKLSEIVKNLYAISTRQIALKFLQSVIHMHVNRFFRSKQRLHELILYNYLNRYYNSEKAKSKNLKKNIKNEVL